MNAITTFVAERLGTEATEQDARQVIDLAMTLWQEQFSAGIGADEPSLSRIDDWLSNRTYAWTELYDAANGDVAAMARVRTEAGLAIL